MLKLIRLELYKIIKRKDSWIIYVMCLIPLLYSIGFKFGASNIEYRGKLHSLSALDFADDMFTFGFYIFVFVLSLSLMMTNSFRSEIDTGTITLLVNKMANKKKIYLAKFLSILIFMTVFTVFFVLFCMICYGVFLGKTIIANNQFFGIDSINDLIRLFSVFLIYIWSVLLIGMISVRFSTYTSMGIFTVIWAVFMYLKAIDATKFLSPMYYLLDLIEHTNITNFITLLLILIITGFIMLVFTFRRFERMDLN